MFHSDREHWREPAAIYLGIVADIEGLAISVIINEWESDIPTFVHAYRRRGAKAAQISV